MNHQLPSATRALFDGILAKLVAVLETAPEHLHARSEFMDYDGSMGGQVLQSEPPIEHDSDALSDLYGAMFEQAKAEGLELREIETQFERPTSNAAWTHRTRWIEVGEFKAFTQKVAPIVEDIGATLQKLGSGTSRDWYKAAFNPGPDARRVLVLHGDRVRVVLEPTPELMQLAARVVAAARDSGLEVTGANWSIRNEDDPGDVDSAVGVIRAWPEAT